MRSRFQAALAQLPAALQTALQPLITDSHFPAMFIASEVESLKAQTGLDWPSPYCHSQPLVHVLIYHSFMLALWRAA